MTAGKIGKFKLFLISLFFVFTGVALSSCSITEVDGTPIYTDSYLVLTGEKLYFNLGETVNEEDALSSIGITIARDNGESSLLTKAAIESGYFRCGKIDCSSVGDKTVDILFNGETYTVEYVVDSYTVNFYLPGDVLYKSVTPYGKDSAATINISSDYNYAVDSAVISSDEESALKFCGWTDEYGKTVTGEYTLIADSDHTATANFYADFLTDEELAAMNIYYENGEKTFGGLSSDSSYYWNDEIDIPESVTKIDLHSVLLSLGTTETLYIPSTAGINYTEINSPYPSSALKRIAVSSDNPALSSDGVGLYAKNYSVLIYYPSAAETVTVNEETEKINDYAFSYSVAAEVDLKNIKILGKYCFAYSDIRSVSCSKDVDSSDYTYLLSGMCEQYIEYDGDELIAIYYVAYEENVPVYYLDRVSSSVKEYSVKEGTREISDRAFAGCVGLESVTLPDGLGHIGAYAFAYCEKLVLINLPETLKTAGEGVFLGCSSLSSMGKIPTVDFVGASSVELNTLPDYFLSDTALSTVALEEGFVSIGSYALSDMTSLKNISVPDSLVYFGDGAFYGDTALSVVGFSDNSLFEQIGEEAFAYCSSLESFPFSQLEKFEKIGKRAFMYSGLKSFSFNDSYTEIDESAFEKCVYLNGISFGEELTNIGEYAFKDCTALTDIDFSNIKRIYEGAFEGCTALREIYLVNGVFIVESYAFKDCTALEIINFGASVGRFGEYEFDKKYNVISASPAAMGCSSLKEINVDSENLTFSSERGILYSYKRDILYFVPAACGESLEIETSVTSVYPYAVSGLSITSIAISEGTELLYENAFYSLENLVEIYVPSSVISLEEGFYCDCPALKKITVDEENEYYYVGEDGNVYNTCPSDEEDEDILAKKDTLAFVL